MLLRSRSSTLFPYTTLFRSQVGRLQRAGGALDAVLGHVWQGTRVDIDAFAAVHRPEWERLRALSTRGRLSGAEADELVRLYQTAAGHLSTVRTSAPDPLIVSELSGLLATARGRIAGSHEAKLSDLSRFFVLSLPAAFYRVRWWTVAVGAIFVLLGTLTGWWVATNPAVLASLGSPEELEQYAEEAFAAYYSNYPAGDFAGQVWTNNAWIAAQCIALGITGVFPAFVLVVNAVGVGPSGGIMAAHGHLDALLDRKRTRLNSSHV